MSINNENNKEPVIELGLALGYSNQCMHRRFFSNDSGAGANAGSGINMTFVTNTLSELVWSPLKGPSNVALLPPHRNATTTTSKSFDSIHNKLIDGDDILMLSSAGQMKGPIREEEKGTCGINPHESIGESKQEMANIADDQENQLSTFSGQGNKTRTDHISLDKSNQYSKPDVIAEALSGSPIDEDVKRLDKIESTSENECQNVPLQNVVNLAELSQKPKETPQTNSYRVQIGRRKGKEKALSDGDQNAMISKNNIDDDDSHESVESCNSAGLFAATTGKRRRSLEEDVVSGSTKGFKKQMHCAQDSSFMNWISNVMKGFSHSIQDEAPLPLSIAGPSDALKIQDQNQERRLVAFEKTQEPPPRPKIIGFQSIFQSLYCSKGDTRGTNKTSNDRGKQLCVSNHESNSEDRKEAEKGKERMISDSSLGKRKTKSDERDDDESDPRSLGKTITSSRISNRNDTLGSSWISRFSLKTHKAEMAVEDQVTIKSRDDPMLLNKLNPILPFHVVKPSGAMASVFARRLDSVKHVNSPRVDGDVVCYFCGIKGHNLRDCSEVNGTELEELQRNIDSCSSIEELNSLCIRCFERNHWAVSCPNMKHIEVESSFKGMQINPSTCEGNERKIGQALSPLKHKDCYASQNVASSFVGNQIVPLSLFAPAERNEDSPRELFDVVRRLRLSRSDIMKWTSSRMSVSQIEGFFLRLRLGKWEEGLGGTGYHVACIIGTQKDKKEKGAKSSLLVKVGGMHCFVESRYISNNDFLEDELMAWWCISSRNGDKIPSEEDLRMKVKTKKSLGF